MFNGRVFSADVITPRLVTGHLTEYRRVVAQMERPGLFAELQVRSFAVCGVLRCEGGVVVGRRHRAAVSPAGMWQLASAGSVDEAPWPRTARSICVASCCASCGRNWASA
jgi:hypothetical protein